MRIGWEGLFVCGVEGRGGALDQGALDFSFRGWCAVLREAKAGDSWHR